MTKPTLERAARAAATACEQVRPSDEHDAEAWSYIARAVLMAVRDEGMNIYHGSDLSSPFPDYSAAEGFRDMIEAILNDGEGG